MLVSASLNMSASSIASAAPREWPVRTKVSAPVLVRADWTVARTVEAVLENVARKPEWTSMSSGGKIQH